MWSLPGQPIYYFAVTELQPFLLSLLGDPLGKLSSLGFIVSTAGQHDCRSLKSLHSCLDGDKPERHYNAGSGLPRCFLTEFFCWVWGAAIIRLLLLWRNPMIKLTNEFVLENSWSRAAWRGGGNRKPADHIVSLTPEAENQEAQECCKPSFNEFKFLFVLTVMFQI